MFDPRAIFSLCLIGFSLTACATTDAPVVGGVPPVGRPAPDPRIAIEPGPDVSVIDPVLDPQFEPKLMPPHMQGKEVIRLALLLPFSSSSSALREEAASMLDAAQLAVFESGDPRLLLIPKDTGGTEDGAKQAARSAIADGAVLFIGPLLSRAVGGAASLAQQNNIPILSFSTNRNVAGNGVYLISYQVDTQVQRIVEYASRNGHETFALLHGQTAYGRQVEQAMQRAVALNAAVLTDIQIYPRATNEMGPSVSLIAHTRERQLAIDEWEKAGGIGDPALDPSFTFELPYTAILLPESGIRLQSLAPLLPYYDVDPRKTRFLGTSQWFDESLTREPALFGGWFSGPNQDCHDRFLASYQLAYAQKPKRLAALAYDAVRLAGAVVAPTEEGDMVAQIDLIEDLNGFVGVTGLFRFGKDGIVERSLAVYEMKRGRMDVLEPAPTTFEPVGF